MNVYIWQEKTQAGIQYGEDTPPIFFISSREDVESEIAALKKSGDKIIRVEKREDLEREIVFK